MTEGREGADRELHESEFPVGLRFVTAGFFGLLAILVFWVGSSSEAYVSDLDQIWHASRALLDGKDPYDLTELPSQLEWGFPLFYPLPALVAAIPLGLMPLQLAQLLFVGLSTALLAFGVTKWGPRGLWIFASGAYLGGLANAQWSPILTAALLLPWLAPILVAKPSVGIALMLSGPGRKFILLAVSGAFLLTGLSFLLDPAWVGKWVDVVSQAPHFRPPLLLMGGPLLLLALLRWRRWEARLLLALACIPHTTLVYEALPLLLIGRGWRQLMLLAGLSLVVFAAQFRLDSRVAIGEPGAMEAFAAWTHSVGSLSVALIYLPALIMVLRRPNDWSGIRL
jgi:hypothetical protein